MVEDLDEGALLSSRAGYPLVEGIVEHEVKLWTVLKKKTKRREKGMITCMHRSIYTHTHTGMRVAPTHFVGVDAVDLLQLIDGPL